MMYVSFDISIAVHVQHEKLCWIVIIDRKRPAIGGDVHDIVLIYTYMKNFKIGELRKCGDL